MSQITENISDNKQIAKNTLFLYFRMILLVCIGLYTSRVILQALGIIDYGVFTAVGGIVAMLGFLNSSMAGSSQRFITFALGEGDNKVVNNAFITSFWVHALVALIFFVAAETLGLWFLYEKMVIPEERIPAALWVYQCSIVASIIAIMSVPYNSLIIAYERMSIFAYISIVEALMMLGIVFLLKLSLFDKLILYAFLLVLAKIVVFLIYRKYCIKYISTSKFQLVFERKLFERMVKFSLWSMNGNLAIVGTSQGINILLNLFFGPAMNAAYGVATQVQSHVYAFCTNLNLASKPQITKLYANSMTEDLHKLVIQSSKFSFYLMLIISLPLMINVSTILYWWLELVPDFAEEFVIIMLLSSMVRSLSFPLIASVHATGDIKRFQIWEGSTLLLVAPVAYLLLRFWHVSPIVVISVYLVLEIVAQFIRVWIVLPMIRMSYRKYLVDVVWPLVLVISCSAIAPLMYAWIGISKVLLAVVASSCFFLFYVILIIYLLGMSNSERRALLSFVGAKLRHFRK